MTPLQELLTQRDTLSPGEIFLQLREGLARSTERSGEGADTHRLLLDYFKLDERASASSFASAFKKYPETTRTLIAMCQDQGLDTLSALIQSLIAGKPQPTGAFKDGLAAQVDALSQSGAVNKGGVIAALKGFSSVAFSSSASETELELSLAWPALEDCLLDQVAQYAAVIDFQWGPTERRKRERYAQQQEALRGTSASALLQAFFADRAPRVIAQPSEWDMSHCGASSEKITIAVHHIGSRDSLTAKKIAEWGQYPAAAQLLAVYQAVNGAWLFCTDPEDHWSAGFALLPMQLWAEAGAEMVQWLTSVDFQDDPDEMPAWVRTSIAFGKIPGDASYWILPVEGPFAGKVLLSNDDVSGESFRFENFDTFVATLRLHPEDIMGSGGYVSYPVAGKDYLLYPVCYLGT